MLSALLRPFAGIPLLLTLTLPLSPSACAQESPQMDLATLRLSAGIHAIRVQVAQTPQEHAIGLMHRASMPTNEGMLFIFPVAAKQCFWMKNTLLPLSAAFILDDGTLVNIEDMKPQTLESHCSRKPVRFVLEMHQGWFAKRGVRPGDKLEGSVFTSAP